MSNQNQDKRTASQRIDDMERGLMALYQTADNMARDMGTIKEAIKLLGNKVDSIVKVLQRGEALNDEAIAKVMVENNVNELKEKVDNLISQGILAAAEEATANSFVVGREIDEKGEVANPRMQFVVQALAENIKAKFVGAKAGQTLELEEGKWKFEVQEIYSIQTPQAEVAPEAKPETPAEDAKPAAEPSNP